jgi:uncharacterized circularly permuted ATP-grasp superfamily protein
VTSQGEPFVDSHTLMAALFHAQTRSQALTDFVLKTKQFEQIEGNEMVKDKLVAFLKADIEYRKEENEYQLLPRIVRKNPWSKIRAGKEKRLGELYEAATEAWQELEMIRKLALPENSLLILKRPVRDPK